MQPEFKDGLFALSSREKKLNLNSFVQTSNFKSQSLFLFFLTSIIDQTSEIKKYKNSCTYGSMLRIIRLCGHSRAITENFQIKCLQGLWTDLIAPSYLF